jgi:hypothetical protein
MGAYVPDFPDNVFVSAKEHCDHAIEETNFFEELPRSYNEHYVFYVKGVARDGETETKYLVQMSLHIEKVD